MLFNASYSARKVMLLSLLWRCCGDLITFLPRPCTALMQFDFSWESKITKEKRM